jgi:methionyl-tRNA formyltransferase
MAVEEGLDTGGVFAREEVVVEPGETAAELRSRLTTVGAELLVRTLDEGLGEPIPQSDEGVTYAEKIRTEDRMLRSEMTTEQFLRVVRIGGAWTEFRDKRLNIGAATSADQPSADQPGADQPGAAAGADQPGQPGQLAPGVFIGDTLLGTADGAVELVKVQPEGKAEMSALDWARGARPSGERIGT